MLDHLPCYCPRRRSTLAPVAGMALLALCASLPAMAAAAGAAPAPTAAGQHAPIVSPDVPLAFVTSAGGGAEPQVVLTSPRWTILLQWYKQIITDADGPWTRKLFRRPASGGALEQIWEQARGNDLDGATAPHVWLAYDDGAVLFSQDTQLSYVAKPGACRSWVPKIDDVECLPAYADTEGMLLCPWDYNRGGALYYVPGERDAFDLGRRIKLTGAESLRYPEPLVKRDGSLFVWLDWPSFAAPPSTQYRLSLFDLATAKGWSKDLEVPGNAKLEHFDGHTVQVSGQRYDAVTGNKQ